MAIDWDGFVASLDGYEQGRLKHALHMAEVRKQARREIAEFDMTTEELELARAGRIIPCIKAIRTRLGLGLLPAKMLMERDLAAHRRD